MLHVVWRDGHYHIYGMMLHSTALLCAHPYSNKSLVTSTHNPSMIHDMLSAAKDRVRSMCVLS